MELKKVFTLGKDLELQVASFKEWLARRLEFTKYELQEAQEIFRVECKRPLRLGQERNH